MRARDQLIDAEMALDGKGRILAVRARAMQNLGAYMVGAALVPLVYSLQAHPERLRHPNRSTLATQGVFTHTAPTNPYRGAGRPEAVYAVERLLDLAADEMGIDPVEIRRRNFIDKAALPYRSATGLVYDSGDFRAAAECLPPARGLERIFRAQQDAAVALASSAAAPSRPTSKTPACSTTVWSCGLTPPARSPSSPARFRTAKPTPPPTANASPIGWASRWSKSASFRATPIRCRSDAALMLPAAPSSAAAR